MHGSSITVNAVGDISFADELNHKPTTNFFENVSHLFQEADITIANLESPLTDQGNAAPGKCTLRGKPEWASQIEKAGINIVSLANNHMMDYGPEGLASTIDTLTKNNIPFVGAGRNSQEASAPFIIKKNGMKIAFLARSSVIVASPCYATPERAGVSFFEIEQTKKDIKSCKELSDIIILFIHWGLEHYHYPTPTQRELARELTLAGADLIIGHHPHVLQGIETIGKNLVAYSLGNFFFNDVPWSFLDEDGIKQDRVLRLNQKNRQGIIFRAELSQRGVENHTVIPTLNQAGLTINPDQTPLRKKQFNRLCSRLHLPAYPFFWRLYSMRQEWCLRIVPLFRGKLKLSKLKKIRPKHFRQLIDKVNRSAKITSEKSVDPYGGPTKKE